VVGRIVTRLGDLYYEIDYQNKRVKRHVDQIKAFLENETISEPMDNKPTQSNKKTPNYSRKIHVYEDPSIEDSTPFTTVSSTPNQSGNLTLSTAECSRSPARPAALLVEQGSPKRPERSPPFISFQFNKKLNLNKLSVISKHINLFNHSSFNWNNVEILDVEHNYFKRLTSEIIHIKEQKNGINLQTDSELLSEEYSTILSKLANS